jgi:hypothetical protein
VGGYCVLPDECSTYPGLWDYSFEIQLETTADIPPMLIVPLATFAINNNMNQCEIYVQYLDLSNGADSSAIIFGSMFWQSVWIMFDAINYDLPEYYIFVNENALSSCQFVMENPIPEGPDAFPTSINITLTANTESSMNGLPTFDATVEGIDSVTPYFLLDFSNDKTVIWGAGCL